MHLATMSQALARHAASADPSHVQFPAAAPVAYIISSYNKIHLQRQGWFYNKIHLQLQGCFQLACTSPASCCLFGSLLAAAAAGAAAYAGATGSVCVEGHSMHGRSKCKSKPTVLEEVWSTSIFSVACRKSMRRPLLNSDELLILPYMQNWIWMELVTGVTGLSEP